LKRPRTHIRDLLHQTALAPDFFKREGKAEVRKVAAGAPVLYGCFLPYGERNCFRTERGMA
jgi:hypothetical protein